MGIIKTCEWLDVVCFECFAIYQEFGLHRTACELCWPGCNTGCVWNPWRVGVHPIKLWVFGVRKSGCLAAPKTAVLHMWIGIARGCWTSRHLYLMPSNEGLAPPFLVELCFFSMHVYFRWAGRTYCLPPRWLPPGSAMHSLLLALWPGLPTTPPNTISLDTETILFYRGWDEDTSE